MLTEALFVGGRSGVGKTTAAAALHDLLAARGVRHAVIEGDALDLAYPVPHLTWPEARLAERNLAAMWGNYRGLGFRRLVYVNTVSVTVLDSLVAAIGGEVRVTAVLLEASDRTATERIARRAAGEAYDDVIEHSARTAARLRLEVTADVRRLDTDGLSPSGVAQRLSDLAGW